MKNRVIQFLLGILYAGMVAAMLISNVEAINGQIERTMAMLEILLLAVPLVIVLGLYIRVKSKAEDAEKKVDSNKETANKVLNNKEPGNGEKTDKGIGRTGNVSVETVFAHFTECMSAYDLSERETEVAWLLYRGYTNRQISEELFIAETTVKKHASHIYEKMDVTGRKEFKAKIL